MIRGACDPAFRAVLEAFAANFEEEELGAGCSVTVDGRMVVDIWGGWADADQRREWTRDTMVNAFSVGKPDVSLVLLQRVERARVELDATADRWWPELLAGRHGATVRDVLCHRAGVPAIRANRCATRRSGAGTPCAAPSLRPTPGGNRARVTPTDTSSVSWPEGSMAVSPAPG